MTRILVVDDSLSVRKAVAIALKPKQLEVVEAASGREALQVLRAQPADLVVCDVIMKDLSGFDVCTGIQEDPLLRGTPVILISGIVNDQVRARAAGVGAALVFSKPFRAAELADEVVRLLGNRTEAAPPPSWTPTEDTGAVALSALRTVPGITFAALVDDQGRLLEQSGAGAGELEAVRSQLAEMALRAEQAGSTRGLSHLTGVILEFRAGLMMASCLATGGLLFVEVNDPSALGLVRYEIRRMLQTLTLPSAAPTGRAHAPS
jgi:CheY-like chemotaxis protein